MHLVKGILHLLWHIVTFPVHVVLGLIKLFVITPIVIVIVLVAVLFLCVTTLAPGLLPRIFPSIGLPSISVPIPGFLSNLSVQTSNPFPAAPTPHPQPLQVDSSVNGKMIQVRWSGAAGNGVLWYQVLRKAVQDASWRRIALVPAAGSASGQYVYDDAELQRGTTYLYGVVAILGNGTESDVVYSATQVVAP